MDSSKPKLTCPNQGYLSPLAQKPHLNFLVGPKKQVGRPSLLRLGLANNVNL